MKKIGVIGRAGVAATNKLAELIETELIKRGAFRDRHHRDRFFVTFSHVCEYLFDIGTQLVIIGRTDIRFDFEMENTIVSLEILA